MALACSICRALKTPAPLLVMAAQIHSSQNQPHVVRTAKPQENNRENKNNNSKRWLTYNRTSKPTPESVRERNKTVASYYNQTAIDEASQQNSVRLAPSTIMYTGRSSDGSHVMKSAQYLRRYDNFYNKSIMT